MTAAAPNLEELNLTFHPGQLDLSMFYERIDKKCPKLESMTIIIGVLKFTKKRAIEEAHISYDFDNEVIMRDFSWLPGLTNLTKLTIETDFKNFEILSKLTKLEELDVLMEGPFTSDDYSLLPNSLPNLSVLTISVGLSEEKLFFDPTQVHCLIKYLIDIIIFLWHTRSKVQPISNPPVSKSDYRGNKFHKKEQYTHTHVWCQIISTSKNLNFEIGCKKFSFFYTLVQQFENKLV